MPALYSFSFLFFIKMKNQSILHLLAFYSDVHIGGVVNRASTTLHHVADAVFVCIFRAVFKRVFRGAKICRT